MEISSTILERALGNLNGLALPIVGVFFVSLMLREPVALAVAARRVRRRPRRLVRRGISLLGLALTIGSPAAAAGRRQPHPDASAAAPSVRTEPGRFPPPRLPGSAGPVADRPWERSGASVTIHPAVHRRSEPSSTTTPDRLFRRWDPGAGNAEERPRPDARAERSSWHAVLPGETLWSIAADRLRTDDVRRIARYWPRIHRVNRDVIGGNPDLIHAGQVLELPPEQP